MAPIAPNNIPGPQGIALTPMELKAISVPQSLLFLLSIEYDMFLCLTTVGTKNGFKLALRTRLAPSYRLLLENGARRFGLTVAHTADESIIISNGTTAHVPMLRYVDYIPGGLHVDELLDAFGVDTKALPRKAKPVTATSAEAAPSASATTFEACFIDYSPYTSDEALHDVHGCGFYLTLDFGLSLATHSHLLHVTFRNPQNGPTAASTAAGRFGAAPAAKGAAPTNGAAAYSGALANFMAFSGWSKLDIRFDDETKRSAIVILPTTQDANDLLEKYENEESDNEIDDPSDLTIATAATFRPAFHVRPVAPTVSVPYIEDAALRKLRAQHWGKVEAFWRRSAVSKNTVVVGNLYDGVTLEEVLKLFGAHTIVSAAMAEDEGPHKRRRVFVTFNSSDATRDALALDGKNTHGKSLKIHSAPPYVDAARRGKTIASVPNPPPSADDASPNGAVKSPGLNVAAKEFVPKFAISTPSATFALPPPYTGGGSPSAPPAYATAPVGASPFAAAALPPAALPPPAYGASSSHTNSPVAEGAPSALPPAYSLPPPYTGAKPSTPSHGPPPPAYTPSTAQTPESPVSQH